MSNEVYDFQTIHVEVPDKDTDVVLTFPGGAQVIIQARPSNADVQYNGSLDVILPKNQAVSLYRGDDLDPAPELYPELNRPQDRSAKQIVTELPGPARKKKKK